MRRRWAWFVIALLVVPACSGGDDAAPADTGEPRSSGDVAADDGDDASTGSDASGDETSGDGASGEGGSGGDAGATTSDASTSTTTTTVAERAQPEPTELPGLVDPRRGELTDDTEVRQGTLDNGLTYFVRANDSPLGRTTLQMAIDAGAVDEFGDATGVAHFVEHMLFNGTEAYPGNELIDQLRSWGADFGPHVNAYTSLDETVYMLTVPSEPDAIGVALDVMGEWLERATISPTDVDDERGVVVDEWRRATQSVGGRSVKSSFDLYYGDTPYGPRWTIGDEASIRDVSADELRAYYERWYRPDNAAIVLVGDVDADAAVGWIEQEFAAATVPEEALPERADHRFERDLDPEVVILTDADQDTVEIEVSLPLPGFEGDETEELQLSLVDELVGDVLVDRLERDLEAGEAPFDSVRRTSNDFTDSLDAPSIAVTADADDAAAALDAVLVEYQRAFQHGFAPDETDIAITELRAELDAEYAQRDEVRDEEWAAALVAHFLTDAPYPSVVTRWEAATAVLDAMAPDALSTRFAARWTNSAPDVQLFAPAGDADEIPTEDDVVAAVVSASLAETSPRPALRELPDELLATPDPVDPDTRRSVRSPGDSRYGYVEHVYPNGVRLRIDSYDQNRGRAEILAGSRGGSSRVPDDDVVDALYAWDVVSNSGLGEFTRTELDAMLADTDFDVSVWSTPYTDRLHVEGTTPDLEAMLQYLHLLMTAPRFSEVALDRTVAEELPAIEDPTLDPDRARFATIDDLRHGGDLRFTERPTPDQFATLDLAGIERVWSERFGDPSDWVFVVIGDVDIAEVEALGERYLGTLPGGDGEGDPLIAPTTAIDGQQAVDVRAGEGERAATSIRFGVPVDTVDGSLRARLDFAQQVLDIRLTAAIRERFGESYSPGVFQWITHQPDPVVETQVEITSAPDRTQAVREIFFAELEQLVTDGPTDAEVSQALAVMEQDYGWKGPYEIADDIIDDAITPGETLDDYVVTAPEFSSWGLDRASAMETLRTFLPADRWVIASSLPRE